MRVGVFAEKEIDMLGVACCGDGEFATAVDLAGRRAEALLTLVSHEFPLDGAPDAIAFAIANPAEVMKVMVRN